MLKKIALRIILLVVLLVLLNFVYSKWFYESDIQKHSDIINLVREVPNDADIIYIGESSNTAFRSDDVDKSPISAFIGDYYPDLNTYDITKPASHAGIYKVLLENISKESTVKTLVVTLNLRSFNAQWIYSNLETPLQKSIVLIKPYPPLLNRFLLSFKAYDIKTEKERDKQFKRKWKRDKFKLPFEFMHNTTTEWDAYIWRNGIRNEDGTKNDEKKYLACHFVKAYSFQIDTLSNPRIKDFDDIVRLAQKRGWNLIFNLMAENVQKAKDLVGENLTFFMNENASLLTNYYENKGVTVVNNLSSVEDELFIDQEWTTEHYAEKGRKIIAKNVAGALKQWYSPYYEEIKYENNYHTSFFNSCDKGIIWGQMQTLSTKMAYSGTRSSETGNGNDYSISLIYPLKIIPDSLKKSINIGFWLFQTSLNHNAIVVVQAEGQEFKQFWNGFPIKNYTEEINKWTKYDINISIPDSIKQADLIRIYVYNPSNEYVYIDDFEINIED